MTIKSIRILVRFDFPSETVRLWDGSGPYVDPDGETWRGSLTLTGLDQVELAINGEAVTFAPELAADDPELIDLAYGSMEEGDVIGSTMQLLIQPCDEYHQPVGAPEVRLTATIDNVIFREEASGDAHLASVVAECTNRFNLRNLVSGAVLSDVDQRARAAILNPSGTSDRFCERVPALADHTIAWPNL
ncbi:hypothetical protein SAMN02745157_0703 [Kaistia soli DSM 19436]|uniref:Uncharacterized protein n=1 Tax=Kaistia soli DSM 19436 TaxID=1122133 RepID=A0A1M4VHC8_9HYPH|nr:hypothetical protein [Kaistia soli]SHE68290.1 hypothetical protein SAMN02745157_0703 [Kaistia soli DSM 19436]